MIEAPALRSLRLRTRGPDLVDALDRTVMLRGANAGGGAKLPPFLPFDFAEGGTRGAPPFREALAAYLAPLASWGFNVLRVPFTWEAVEPTPGREDSTYLTRLEQLVDAAAQLGLRVILDAHQDIFCRAFGGDGFPAWAASGAPRRAPLLGPALWGLGYLVDGRVRRSFDRFWRDDGGIQSAFARMWQRMAARFASVDAVIAFEILNEPAPGTAASRSWAREVLPAFHSRMADLLRASAPEVLVAFGTPGIEAIRDRTDTTRPAGEGLVFAPHHYEPARLMLAFLGLSRLGPLVPRYDAVRWLAGWRAQGDAWDLPVVLGEFGLPARAWRAAALLTETYRGLDQHRLSGTVWEYSTRVDDWNEEGMSLVDPGGGANAITHVPIRPYPAAIAGTLASFGYTPELRRAHVRWRAVPGVSEIVWPQSLGSPRNVQVSGGTCAFDASAGRVRVASEAATDVELIIEGG